MTTIPKFSQFSQAKTGGERKMDDADFPMYDADFPFPDMETIHETFPLYDLEGNPLPNPYDGDGIRART